MARMNPTEIGKINGMCFAASTVGLGTKIDEISTQVNALEIGAATPTELDGFATLKRVWEYAVSPAAGTATATHAAITLTDAAQDVATGITNPDVPRILTVKGNDANVTGNVVITGTDIHDSDLEETIALNGSSEVLGTKAFKTVTNINVPAYAVAGTETVSVGRGNKIGFPVPIPNAALVIAKSFDSAGAADAGTVTAAATVAGSIYAVAGTMNGTKVVSLVFVY